MFFLSGNVKTASFPILPPQFQYNVRLDTLTEKTRVFNSHNSTGGATLPARLHGDIAGRQTRPLNTSTPLPNALVCDSIAVT